MKTSVVVLNCDLDYDGTYKQARNDPTLNTILYEEHGRFTVRPKHGEDFTFQIFTGGTVNITLDNNGDEERTAEVLKDILIPRLGKRLQYSIKRRDLAFGAARELVASQAIRPFDGSTYVVQSWSKTKNSGLTRETEFQSADWGKHAENIIEEHILLVESFCHDFRNFTGMTSYTSG